MYLKSLSCWTVPRGTFPSQIRLDGREPEAWGVGKGRGRAGEGVSPIPSPCFFFEGEIESVFFI